MAHTTGFLKILKASVLKRRNGSAQDRQQMSTADLSRFGLAFAVTHGTIPDPSTAFWIAFLTSATKCARDPMRIRQHRLRLVRRTLASLCRVLPRTPINITRNLQHESFLALDVELGFQPICSSNERPEALFYFAG